MERKQFIKKWIPAIVTAILFFAVTMPFRRLFQVVAVTEVRPASAFNPLFGLLYGVPGALGCAVGNLAADILSGYSPLLCVLGFLVQMFYGLLPHLIWKKFGWEIRLHTSLNVLRYMTVMLIDSLLTAILLGSAMFATKTGSLFSMTTVMLFLNNFVFCMVLGIPILLTYTHREVRKKGGKFSLNERFILIFLFLAILSATMIGYIAYYEMNQYVSQMLELWNRVYIYIALNLFIFCIVILCFLQYAEKNVTIPLEKLSTIASEYICTEKDGRLDTAGIVEQCSQYVGVHGEAGELAEAFRDMAMSLDGYINNLTRITAEKERISAELNVATQIQADMLPNIFPAFPERKEFNIYASMNPAKEVGGDFYDFFLVDEDHLALVIADVSGKGVPAALFMVISKTLLKNQALMGESPKEILIKVNNQLCENNKAQMFVTAWLGILEISTGRLTAANAGHEYPAIRRKNGNFELFREKHGFVLAGMENMRYQEYDIQLQKGDTIFVYTDGVTEATNNKEELYGVDRMLSALNHDRQAMPKQLVEQVQADIDEFVGEAMQFDDITMLSMTYHGIPNAHPQIALPATLENWGKVQAFISGELQKVDGPLKAKVQLETAAEEIYVNIASYAYPASVGEVKVDMEILDSPERVCITFEDQGIPYDPLQQKSPDVTLSAAERSIGGLGIHMVRKSMDEVKYEYAHGCNILSIVKGMELPVDPKKNGSPYLENR